MYANIIVALSNFSALYFCKNRTSLKSLIVYVPMIASLIYHLAETKHGLIGLYPLNKYASHLLNIDRAFAIASFCFGIYRFYFGICGQK